MSAAAGVPRLNLDAIVIANPKPTVTQLARARLEELTQLFDEVDLDGSGEIEADELDALLRTFLKSGGVMPSSRQIAVVVQSALSTFAAPGSAALEFHQFVAFLYSEEQLQHHTRNVEPEALFAVAVLLSLSLSADHLSAR